LILELHPDNQYDPAFVPELLAKARSDRFAIVIGSRFLPARRALEGGMPWWKFAANRTLTFLNGALVGVHLSEFHTGYRVYNAAWVRTLDFDEFSDDFLLGFQTLARAAEDGWRIGEVAAYSRYFKEASSNPFIGSTIYGLGTLSESLKVFGRRLGRAVWRSAL
jgi:hypothetical protein